MTASLSGFALREMADLFVSEVNMKFMLATSAYTWDSDTHEFRSSVTNEIVGTGYTEGGFDLLISGVDLDLVGGKVTVSADDVSIGPITATGVAQIITYVDSGDAATDRIVSVHTFAAEDYAAEYFEYLWQDGIVFQLTF